MQRIVISGANRGIGLEFVRQLLADGRRVVAGCRKPGQARELTRLAAAHPGHLHVLPLDTAQEKSIAEFARETGLVLDGVDVLINNAGMLVSGERFGNLVAKSFADSFAVNATGPLLLAQALAPLLLQAPGSRIVNLSSIMGSIAAADTFRTVSYAMSKAALNMATKRLAVELKTHGATVVSVHPGWVQTDMGGAQAALTPEQSVAGLIALIDGLTLDHSGGFYAHDGSALPW